METLTKIVIPISAFIVGVLVTILLKRFEFKRNSLRQHVEKSSKLATDWYNQIHNVTLKSKDGTNKGDLEVALFDYQHSREFLPSLQQSIIALKQHKNGRSLVKELERFLNMVTIAYYPNTDLPRGRDDFSRAECAMPLDWDIFGRIRWNISMKDLDEQVQKIQYEAGKLLS
jgi:hypothetical protein